MFCPSCEHPEWAPFTGDHPITIFEFDGETLPDKFVQPYLDWRRNLEAAWPGSCFNEPSMMTCFPPKVYRELISSPFYSVALHHLRTPDPWSAAVVHRAVTRHTQRVVTFTDFLASAGECVHVVLPNQHGEPNLWQRVSAYQIAVRAWNHIHLLMHWLEDTPMARAADRAGIYVPAHTMWTEEEYAKWVNDNSSTTSGSRA